MKMMKVQNDFTITADASPSRSSTETIAKPAERDPNGLDPKAGGAKLDAGKPCMWRGAVNYFPRALSAVAAISTFGAAKYSWGGWRTVPEGFERYSDAMVRHLIAESKEGPLDNDSGLHHAAHCAWNALARLEFILKKEEEDETD
jgi:hypothetical protein